MSTQLGTQSEPSRSLKGDVMGALSHLTASIAATDEVLDELRKRLDLIILDLPEPSMAQVGKEEPSRSPLAQELHNQAARIIKQRLRLERLCEIIQV